MKQFISLPWSSRFSSVQLTNRNISRIFLDVPVRVFSDESSIWISGLSRLAYPGRMGIIQSVEGLKGIKDGGRRNSRLFAACLPAWVWDISFYLLWTSDWDLSHWPLVLRPSDWDWIIPSTLPGLQFTNHRSRILSFHHYMSQFFIINPSLSPSPLSFFSLSLPIFIHEKHRLQSMS